LKLSRALLLGVARVLFFGWKYLRFAYLQDINAIGSIICLGITGHRSLRERCFLFIGESGLNPEKPDFLVVCLN
jgi:hypothetical protein